MTPPDGFDADPIKAARYYGRQIPPPLNPCHSDWIAPLLDGYNGLTGLVQQFSQRASGLAIANKLDYTVTKQLLDHFDEFLGAIRAAADLTKKCSPASDLDEVTISPEVYQIADHAKYVYAIGSRDVAWMQYRLQQLAYTGRIDIEAHNELQHELCYGIGEPIYSMTTSNLHDDARWDGCWDWDDNTYSDGRQVMIRAHFTDWRELFDEVPWNPAITVYGDGVINEHQEGVVCLIVPPEPRPEHEFWHPVIEISFADLRRQPWTNDRWDANTAAEWNQAEVAVRDRRRGQTSRALEDR